MSVDCIGAINNSKIKAMLSGPIKIRLILFKGFSFCQKGFNALIVLLLLSEFIIEKKVFA